MGWDYTHATHYTRTGAIDRKAELDERFAAYQFKRPFWYDRKSNSYMPVNRIPDNYEVVSV